MKMMKIAARDSVTLILPPPHMDVGNRKALSCTNVEMERETQHSSGDDKRWENISGEELLLDSRESRL